jgi:hypothetical protein
MRMLNRFDDLRFLAITLALLWSGLLSAAGI